MKAVEIEVFISARGFAPSKGFGEDLGFPTAADTASSPLHDLSQPLRAGNGRIHLLVDGMGPPCRQPPGCWARKTYGDDFNRVL